MKFVPKAPKKSGVEFPITVRSSDVIFSSLYRSAKRMAPGFSAPVSTATSGFGVIPSISKSFSP